MSDPNNKPEAEDFQQPDSGTPGAPKAPLPPAPPALPPPLVNLAEVHRTLSLMCEPDQVLEVRVLKGALKNGWGNPRTYVGYFRGSEAGALVKGLRGFAGWSGAYITLNPVDDTMYALSAGKFIAAKSGAQDRDVPTRTRLLLDFDPIRRSGISSTAEELEHAMERARTVRSFLTEERGWPMPIFACSGNGAHLLYAISLPPEDGTVRSVLLAASSLYSDELVDVDLTVFNPARITKLYGTLACKGDSIPERPHRMSHIQGAPDTLVVVPREKLEELVQFVRGNDPAVCVGAPQGQSSSSKRTQNPFDVPGFLGRCSIGVHHEASWQGGTKWILGCCPMGDSHEVDQAAWVAQFPSGAVAAGCHHASCTWGWRDLRDSYETRPLAANGVLASGVQQPNFAPIRLRVGMRVRVNDGHDNFGTIIEATPGAAEALVHFQSPEGHEAQKLIDVALITPCSGADDRDAIPPRSIKIWTLEDLYGHPRQPWVLPGVLRRKELAVVYGAAGCAKTFLGVDLACHLTSGLAWHVGRKPRRSMRVLYVCAEGGHEDVLFRVLAWFEGRSDSKPNANFDLVESHLRVIPEAVQLIGKGDLEGLLAACKREYRDREGPDLIIFDTLARCAVDVEENSSKEMGGLINRADWLREELNSAVLLVHHEGKDSSGRERGSSALRGACDLMLHVAKGGKPKKDEGESSQDPNRVVVKCDKAKRQAPFRRFDLRLRPISFQHQSEDGQPIGPRLDEDGQPMGSAVLLPVQKDEDGPFSSEFFEEQGLINRIIAVLSDDFKTDEHRSTTEFLAALKARGISKSNLYKVRTEARKQGRIDWEKVGRSTCWRLGPKALPTVKRKGSGADETLDLFDGSASDATGPNDSEVS